MTHNSRGYFIYAPYELNGYRIALCGRETMRNYFVLTGPFYFAATRDRHVVVAFRG